MELRVGSNIMILFFFLCIAVSLYFLCVYIYYTLLS